MQGDCMETPGAATTGAGASTLKTMKSFYRSTELLSSGYWEQRMDSHFNIATTVVADYCQGSPEPNIALFGIMITTCIAGCWFAFNKRLWLHCSSRQPTRNLME
jgi:hypothetical protein